MHYKQEFIDMVNRMGLEDAELTLAEIVWQKCELATEGKSRQLPKLLIDKEYVRSANDLTRSEKQWLNSLFAYMLNVGDLNEYTLKVKVQELWDRCDPEDDGTIELFKELNDLKDLRRKFRAQRNKLAIIQRKLKKTR